MRLLAPLSVLLLPLALCQYQQNNQRYQQQQFNGQQQFNQQQQFQQGQRIQPMNQQGYQQQNMQNGQQFYQQQNGGQQKSQSGRTEVVNTPTRLVTSNVAVGDNAVGAVNGAQVDIQLTSYSDPDLSLGNSTTCRCPLGTYCDFLPSTGQNNCMFSFMTVISAKDQSVQFFQSDFYPFEGSISTGNWTNQFSFPFPSKPVAIDVIVQHLGVVIDKQTAALKFFNHLTLVDTFVVDVANYLPTQNQNRRTYQLTGKRLNTQLSLILSVQCINGMMGDNCDLACTNTGANAGLDNVICTDSAGRNVSCRWSNSYKTTVSDCVVCNAVGINGTCAQVIREQFDGVSYAFRTWTIVLGCLLGLSLLMILCLIICFIILRNRDPRDDDTTTYKTTTKYNNGKSAAPLLEDEWAAPRRPIMPERTDDRGYAREHASSVTRREEHQV